jgi:hypothetical protein
MISQAKLRALDTYFYRDHRARVINAILGIAVAAAALLFSERQNFSQPTSMGIALAAILVFYVWRLSVYDPVLTPHQDRVVAKYPVQMALTRRYAVIGLSAATIIALIFFSPFFSEFTEAAVVNRKLRRLVSSGRKEEAKAYANEIKDARIPLALDNLFLLDNVTSLQAPPVYSAGNSALLWLDSTDILEIALPLFYFPKGTYRFEGSLSAEFVSIGGDGIGKSTMVFDPAVDSISRTLLVYASNMPCDAVIVNFSFRASHSTGGPTQFLSVQPQSKRLAVSHVEVQGMDQILDNIIWVETVFLDCTIKFLGGSFNLHNAVFRNCKFEFPSGFPKTLQNLLTSHQGQPLSLEFP